MADVTMWILMVVCVAGIGTAITTTKGFYCRDPDTGKLYPVNTTWPSSSFCGSYTCKLRRRNITEEESPFRQIHINADGNITEVHEADDDGNKTNDSSSDVKDIENVTNANNTGEESDIVNTNKTEIGHLHIEVDKLVNNEDVKNIVKQKVKNMDLTAVTKDGDRYLTEDEIKSLTELLHAVKKSDLEAIVEMYNLAQDVYKEIDTAAEENLIEETIQDLKDKHNVGENFIGVNFDNNRRVSYWYEPLGVTKNKADINDIPQIEEGKVTASDEDLEVPKLIEITARDMAVENSKMSPVTVAPPPYYSNQDYFKGTLSNEDYRKYYYPISNFQRSSSYVHPQRYVVPQNIQVINAMPQNDMPYSMAQTPKPMSGIPLYVTPQNGIPQYSTPQNVIPPYITPQTQYAQPSEVKPKCDHSPYINTAYLPQPSWLNRIVKKPFTVENQRGNQIAYLPIERDSRPVAHLPYPLNYAQGYNITYPTPNYNDNQWAIWNLYNNHYQRHLPSYLNAAYVAHLPKAILVNPAITDNQKIEHVTKPKTVKEDIERPEWQTDSLSKKVLDEVKANIVGKSKLFPFLRKKIKLEKVGKVLKLDEIIRDKRDVNRKGETGDRDGAEEFGVYEVYLEKSTCEAGTEPGFFRIGNSSEPYPGCCPQRIAQDINLP